MNVHEAIRERRTVHHYKADPISPDILERALEAGTYAPNHKLSFPWRFVVVGPKTRQRLYEQAKAAMGLAESNDSEERCQLLAQKILNPAALVAVVCVRSSDPFRAREDYATVACAIQNISLSLHADGVSAKWGTGALSRAPATYELLGIPPAEEEIVGFLWAGIPEVTPPLAPRPPKEIWLRELA